MNVIELAPRAVTIELLEKLDQKGLIRLFHPTPETQNPPAGENIAVSLYESAPEFGSHRLLAVGVNKHCVRLGTHSDHEEFLIPPHRDNVKPLYLVISFLKTDVLYRKNQDSLLSADDFICLSMYPSPRGAEMFTMLAGTVHCELTDPGDAPIGTFYVTESTDLDIQWIDLDQTEFEIQKK